MVKQAAPPRIYTTLNKETEKIRNDLRKCGYKDSEMLNEGLRCLAHREGILPSYRDLSEMPGVVTA